MLLLYTELFTSFLYKIYHVLQLLLTVKDRALSEIESEVLKELEMPVSTYTKNKHHFTSLIYSNLWLKALVVLNCSACFVIKSHEFN